MPTVQMPCQCLRADSAHYKPAPSLMTRGLAYSIQSCLNVTVPGLSVLSTAIMLFH